MFVSKRQEDMNWEPGLNQVSQLIGHRLIQNMTSSNQFLELVQNEDEPRAVVTNLILVLLFG